MFNNYQHKIDEANNQIIEQNDSLKLLEMTRQLKDHLRRLNEVIKGVEYSADGLENIVDAFKTGE